MNQIVSDATERRAAALAEVNYMNDALITARETIEQLKADLHREEDRVVMMVEERDRYRHESIRFRKLLIQLATKMVNATLLMEEAKDTLTVIDEIDEAPTPPAEVIDRMEKSAIEQLQAAAQIQGTSK
jgi:predicted RecB family endonuclease